jgi:N-glycosidase YbiA
MSIRFYSTKDAYGEFSNFASFPFDLEGMRWTTTEHYFQAQKFHDPEYRERIRLVTSPMVAARLGRSRSVPIRDDWETVKDDVMRKAIRAKFDSHPELKRLLLATGNEELVEQTTQDHYWGCGTSGTGRNMLGILLMELRQELNTSLRDQGG